MEFFKYHDYLTNKDLEDRAMPRVGTLIIKGDFEGSDCNFYPNHEVFGECKAGSYPLYGKFKIVKGYYTTVFHDSVFANIPGVNAEGKSFEYPFRIYGHEVGEYLGEGKKRRGTTFRIELDEPFHFDPEEPYKGLQGYDLTWEDHLNLSHKNFASLDEAKKEIASDIGKYGVSVTNVEGKKTILIATDLVFEKLWVTLREYLTGIAPAAKPNKDLVIEETRRLKNEFIKSLEKACGAKVVMVSNEYSDSY